MNSLENSVERVLKNPPQFTRLKRHISTLLYHSTPKKIFNLLKVEWQRKRGSHKVKGFPYIIIIDSGNICNLKCPLCPTGLQENGVTRSILKFSDFKKIVDNFKAYAYEIILHNWGEPFLNNEILTMIRYCADHNIGTNLSSNMNILPFSGEEVVKSGLEYLIISLDGTSQEVYSKYRVNGNIDAVIANLKKVTDAKQRLKSKTPIIEWQYLVMKHNLHQTEDARRLSSELGVDLLRFIPVGLPFDTQNKQELMKKWYPYVPTNENEEYLDDRFLQKPIKGRCFYLYRSATITALGKVTPCCAVWKDDDKFGDILQTDFSEIWNNLSYRSARSLFSNVEYEGQKEINCCNRCNLFEK